MSIFIQIGAGAGDLDFAANYRDGFTTYVKNINLSLDDSVVVVEANKLNIPELTKCWHGYSNIGIYQMAISTKGQGSAKELTFYYAEEDSPFYQVASLKKSHVEKFYPEGQIKSFDVPTMQINDFLESVATEKQIEVLAIDIEGLDLEVVAELDISKFDIHKLSFEKSHASALLGEVEEKLRIGGFIKSGSGFDPHNSDVLWVKPSNFSEFLYFKLRNSGQVLKEMSFPIKHRIKLFLKSLK